MSSAEGLREKAGLISGDRIIKVDTTTIAGVNMPQDSMVRLMRGKRGSKVDIGIQRNGSDELVHFIITRDKIPMKSIDVAFMINDTTGFVKLSKFAKTSYYEFLKAVVGLKEKGMKKLIFDLRDNTGGFLDQALMISNEFLQKGELVFYMEGRKRPRQDVYADGTGSCRDIELAVLINEASASSSEIVAGAMQDNDRATIYGVRSFGKGLVQEPVYFSDGSGIRLTVARYHTPTGRCIQKPYSDDYAYDLLDRYKNGELMSADSIKVNDSLKYTTPKGKVVYGGGGIIPDVFVPLDTTGVTDYLVKCNRQSAQVKFAIETSDKYRAQMRSIKDMDAFYKFIEGLDLKKMFTDYTKSLGFEPTAEEWAISGDIILTQVKAILGRYTPLDDDAFYPIYLTIDNTVQAALEG
jgi:Periplasmic protease